MTVNEWDRRFLELAGLVAGWSKDPSTKVGCVIVDPSTRAIVAVGYNGMPRGIADDVDARWIRPEKFMWVEHAERNAVYNCARRGTSPEGCTLYTRWFPCVDCARAIVQSGISRVVSVEPDLTHESWGRSWETSLRMLREAEITIDFV